jgi:hypothetical protein
MQESIYPRPPSPAEGDITIMNRMAVLVPLNISPSPIPAEGDREGRPRGMWWGM